MMERKQISDIIKQAYDLYMPQVESEITLLADIVKQKFEHNDCPTVLEIGTKTGGTFYIWNSLVQERNGLCISIDMSDGGKHGGVSEESMEKRNQWFHERFDKEQCCFILGDSHHIDTYVELTCIFDEKYHVKTRDFREPIDFLFIDGDHTYEGVKKDFQMYSEFVKENGLIAFHDIIDSERHRQRDVYVAKFWQELTRETVDTNVCVYEGRRYEFKEIIGNPEQDWAGIGLVKKIK